MARKQIVTMKYHPRQSQGGYERLVLKQVKQAEVPLKSTENDIEVNLQQV